MNCLPVLWCSKTSAKVIANNLQYKSEVLVIIIMKKVLVVFAAVALLATVGTSCSKGCHCYAKTDIYHVAPVFEDETMSKADCDAKQAELNDEWGANLYKCK